MEKGIVTKEQAGTLLDKAIEQGLPVESIERLINLQLKLRDEWAKGQLNSALAAFQAECPVVEKSATAKITTRGGGQYEYRYAPIDAIWTTIKPLLVKHGLTVAFDAAFVAGDEPAQLITCVVSHTEGGTRTSSFQIPLDPLAVMSGAQRNAAAQTFAKRYALCNALGLVTADEDKDGGTDSGDTEMVTPAQVKEIQDLIDAKYGSSTAKLEACRKWMLRVAGTSQVDQLTANTAAMVLVQLKGVK